MANLYPNVTLLITHYNRPNSLERLLESFDELNFSFAEIIVSDDGSKEEHVIALRKLQEE
ncbi:MAG: glycosyltransferase, partial [Pyrinomonadaceae bacterium]|nr:glycosyltransferase [Sphingobacteriaceae bacterium]